MKDLFDTDFFFFPSIIYEKDNFVSHVGQLREKLTDPQTEGYLWKQNYSKDVPADGFITYSHQIWVWLLPSYLLFM